MSRPTKLKGGYITLRFGDGAMVEAFTVVCGISQFTFTHQVNTSDEFSADCDLPEDVPTRDVNLTGKQWDLSADISYNAAQADELRALVGVPTNYRVVIGKPVGATQDAGTWAGKGVLTNSQFTASPGQFASASISIVSDGVWVFTPAV